MQKDMKIGMFVGLVLAAAIMLYVCTRPTLSPKARMLRQNNTVVQSDLSAELSEDQWPVQANLNQQQVSEPSEQIDEPATAQPRPQPVNDITFESIYREQTYQAQKFYVVRRGDTLSKISRIYYGTPNKWYKIYEANRDVLDNPDMLKPGSKLRIPQ